MSPETPPDRSNAHRRSNRLTHAIEETPSVSVMLGGFAVYLFGALLMVIAVFVALPGLLFVTATIGDGGWDDRLLGVGMLAGGVGLLLAGRWLADRYMVESHR